MYWVFFLLATKYAWLRKGCCWDRLCPVFSWGRFHPGSFPTFWTMQCVLWLRQEKEEKTHKKNPPRPDEAWRRAPNRLLRLCERMFPSLAFHLESVPSVPSLCSKPISTWWSVWRWFPSQWKSQSKQSTRPRLYVLLSWIQRETAQHCGIKMFERLQACLLCADSK